MLTFKASKEIRAYLKSRSKSIGLVPTMGALHSGHLSLVKKACAENDYVVISIYVNPTQFNHEIDLESYPSNLEDDMILLDSFSDQIIFYTPDHKDLYPGKIKSKSYNFGSITTHMEGQFRPGHFNGVATVVEALFKNINPKTDLCGIMMETFQGWGAVFYPREFVQEVSLFAKENDLLLAFDEMQAGFGRTGELFGYMNYEVEPDLLACGKGASSSLPLSIVLGRKEIMDLPGIGSMSSTHSANPLVCAAGLANIKAFIDDGLIQNSKNLGKIFDAKKYWEFWNEHGFVGS